MEQTLPVNLEHLDGDSVIVLLDYNSPDGLADYVQTEHSADLDSGRLVYYRAPDPERFHMAHAKNLAHRCGRLEGADVLVNLDADNWTGDGFAGYVSDKFEAAREDSEAIFLGCKESHRGLGDLLRVRTPMGCFGRIGVSWQAFRHAGGYDEVFDTWSPDDKDFAQRLRNLGYSWHQIRPCFLSAINHDEEVRFQDYQHRGFDEGQVLGSRAKMTIANGGKIGTGIVYRNFSPRPIEVRSVPTRVFGIGMHKTGTSSLAEAFRRIGYDSAHWESPNWARYIWHEMRAAGRSSTLEMSYALSDLPIPLLYRELDRAYPGSKFVLTIRPEDDWIRSIRGHWSGNKGKWDRLVDIFSNEIHAALYGTTEFDEERFRARYRRHNEEVVEYFKDRSDLLVLDVRGARMSDLCTFLDVPAVGGTFPHENHWS